MSTPDPATVDWVPLGGVKGDPGPPGVAPPGAGLIWFSNTPPSGWAILDGSTITNAQTLNPTLWANVDPTWKSGSNIILPDMRGRVPVGKGAHADVDAFTDNDGVAVASRTIKHRHTVTDPQHAHAYGQNLATWAPSTPTPTGGPAGHADGGADSATSNAATGITVGPAGTPLDAPGFQVVNWIIKL